MRPTLNWSSYRGRGDRGKSRRGYNNILAQMGNKKLIASNIDSSSAASSTGISEIFQHHLMYQLFMKLIKSKQQSGETSSYAAITNEEKIDTIKVYAENEKDKVILHLEENDLQCKNDSWQLMSRYFDTSSYVATSYKSSKIPTRLSSQHQESL